MALLGTVLDFSASMRVNVDEKDGNTDHWLRSIFEAFNDLLEHNEISEDNKIFAIGIGANVQLKRNTFDLLGTLEANAMTIYSKESLSHDEIICESLKILKASGAPFVDTWAPVDKVKVAVSGEKAKIILNWLRTDQNLSKKVALEILPSPCRNRVKTYGCRIIVGCIKSTVTATKEDIEQVVHQIIALKIPDVTQSSVKNLKEASAILKGSVGLEPHQHLTKDRIHEIMENIEPFIYGETPLNASLNQALNIFSSAQYKENRKFLFVLSDGISTDRGRPPIDKLKVLDVQTISCYITSQHIDNPKQLFSTQRANWDKATKFMFNLSSEKKTQEIPRTVFVKKDWDIEETNNMTKLFVQINHPDLLCDVTDLVRNVITSKDALADLLASVDLDCYINQTIKQMEPKLQVGGTCYAYAAATVLHLAMHRIKDRDDGYPKFEDLKNQMIEIYGEKGATTIAVLEQMCPLYRLHVTEVNFKEALAAVAAKRPVLTTFSLNGKQWDAFSHFFNVNPRGILSEEDLQKTCNVEHPSESGGHAVVLTSYSIESLVFMNSWGKEWADNGFFSIANSKVLSCKFYDVYWTVNDLSGAEKMRFELHGLRLSKKERTRRMVSYFESEYNFNESCHKN